MRLSVSGYSTANFCAVSTGLYANQKRSNGYWIKFQFFGEGQPGRDGTDHML